MPLNEDEKAELVAYLDGELDESATQVIEAKIATDPDARAELDVLQQTWGMLDYLPKATPSPNFTNKTLERLTLEDLSSRSTVGDRSSWPAAFGWTAALLIAAGVGYGATAFLWPTPAPIPVTDRDLEPYADWLEQVRQQDPQAYQAIKNAPTAAARLALIKERRDREWMMEQPKALREQWDALKGEARTDFVAKLHQEAEQKHSQWEIAQPFWKDLEGRLPLPSKLADFSQIPPFSPKVEDYVTKFLMPTLTADEKKKLANAEGRWPDYPIALVKIASKHPSVLPPDKPQLFSQLPVPVQDRLVHRKDAKAGINQKLLKEIRFHEGPSFASKVVAIGLRENRLPFAYEYLAPNYKSLEKPMQEFVAKKLSPLIDNPENQADNRKLTDAEGKWPEYPLMIEELSRKHNLQPPWHILPEPDRWHWNRYRDVRARSWGSDVAKEKK